MVVKRQQKNKVKSIRKQSSIKAAINSTTIRIEKEGYVVLPSTQSGIKSCVRKAVKKGLLKNSNEINTATVALVAGAVTAAKESKSKRVTNKHLSKGWDKHIKIKAIGNCPPHKCLLRSAVLRKDELLKSNTVFNTLSIDIE